MALLKSGSTVGGNLIWHQGILSLFPAGDTLYFKDYKIYTTKDKPTPTEIGVFDKNQINRSSRKLTDVNNTEAWYKIGTAKLGQNGHTLRIDTAGSAGYNGVKNQAGFATIILRTGNGTAAVNAKGRVSATVTTTSIDNRGTIGDLVIIESSANTFDVYAKLGGFSTGMLFNAVSSSVEDLNAAWEFKFEKQATAPVGNQDIDIAKVYTSSDKPSKADVGLSNLTNDVQVKKSGDTMTGVLVVNSKTGLNTNPVIKIEATDSASPLLIRRAGANTNVSIGFEPDGQQRRYLGISNAGELHWGSDINQANNGKVYTTEFKPTHDEVQAFFHDPNGLLDKNLNDVVNPGHYYQKENGNALPTRNYPEQVAGVLTVLNSRANDWGRTQEYRPFNSSKIYTRHKTSATAWATWSKVYLSSDKPSYTDLGVIPNGPLSDWNTNDNYLRKVDASANSPDNGYNFGIHIPNQAGNHAIQIAGRENSYHMRGKVEGAWKQWNTLYHTGNKPSKADVGLNNVTNDAQVKKAGDTMTGELSVPTLKATEGSIYIKRAGNKHLWFQGANGEDVGLLYTGDDSIMHLRPGAGNKGFVNVQAERIQIDGAHWSARNDHSYAAQYATHAPVMVEFGDQSGTSDYYPIVRGRSSSRGYGYKTFVDFGMLRTGNNQWGRANIVVGSAEASNPQAIFSFEIEGHFTVPGTVRCGGELQVGNGNARYLTDGNVIGPVWRDANMKVHVDFVQNLAQDAWNKANDGQVNRVNEVQRGPQQYVGEAYRNIYEIPHGYITGYSNSTNDGNIKYSGWYFRVPQIHVPGRGWTEIWNQ